MKSGNKLLTVTIRFWVKGQYGEVEPGFTAFETGSVYIPKMGNEIVVRSPDGPACGYDSESRFTSVEDVGRALEHTLLINGIRLQPNPLPNRGKELLKPRKK